MKPKIISLYVITRRFDPWNHVKPTRNSNNFWEGSSLPYPHSVTFSTREDHGFKKIMIHNQHDPPPHGRNWFCPDYLLPPKPRLYAHNPSLLSFTLYSNHLFHVSTAFHQNIRIFFNKALKM